MTQAIRQKLLDAHNELRNRVASGAETQWTPQPAASNMKALSWDSELEHWAMSYAGRCPSNHRNPAKRVSGDGFGENLYWGWSSVKQNLDTLDYRGAIKAFYDEV
jgi:hypothetical protein